MLQSWLLFGYLTRIKMWVKPRLQSRIWTAWWVCKLIPVMCSIRKFSVFMISSSVPQPLKRYVMREGSWAICADVRELLIQTSLSAKKLGGMCIRLLYFVVFSSQITKNTRTLLVSQSHTHLIGICKYYIHVHGRKLSTFRTGHLENWRMTESVLCNVG